MELKKTIDSRKDNTAMTLMTFDKFRSCLIDQFTSHPPSETLINSLFERFRPVKIKENCEGITTATDVDIVDFLLALNLLSRITQDKKIKSKTYSSVNSKSDVLIMRSRRRRLHGALRYLVDALKTRKTLRPRNHTS